MVTDIIFETKKLNDKKVVLSSELEEAMMGLREYLFSTVYMNEKIKSTFEKAKRVVRELYYYLCENKELFWQLYGKQPTVSEKIERDVCDFIAGMTDSYALSLYSKLFLPSKWEVN